MLKMFVNNISKTPTCFGHSCLTIFRVSSQPNLPQTSTSCTHTHRQHTPTYQINNLTTQTRREVVTVLSTKKGPLKTVKQL